MKELICAQKNCWHSLLKGISSTANDVWNNPYILKEITTSVIQY
jgi:hypothetical protein